MPQLHMYLPRELADEVKRRAEARGSSVSAYLADLVKGQISDDWPESFFSEVVGGWAGEPLRRAPQPPLEVREVLDGSSAGRPSRDAGNDAPAP